MRQVELDDIPGRAVDTAGLAAAASALVDAADRLRDAGAEALGIWAGLAHAYDAPEAPTLHAAMDPVAADTSTYADAAAVAAAALARYVDDVADVRARMTVTSSLVSVLSVQMSTTPHWRTDPVLTAQNATLRRQVQAAEDDLDQAAHICASRIRSSFRGARSTGNGRDTPYLSAPGPRSWVESHQQMMSGDDPRTNPLFFQGKTPKDVSAWWRSLPAADREQIAANHPHLIGNRDGIPAAARDAANRIRLATARTAVELEIYELERRIAGDPLYTPRSKYFGPAYNRPTPLVDVQADFLLGRARERLAAVTALQRTISRSHPDGRRLVTFDLTGEHPRAAVAIGDLDTSERIGILVGGTSTTVAGTMEKMDIDAQNLLDEVRRSPSTANPSPTAVVAWIDYDAPPTLSDAVVPDQAYEGGRRLAAFVSGITDTQSTEAPTEITLFGHSYGAAVVNYAAALVPDKVENIVIGGAPGVGHITTDDVNKYAMLAAGDPIKLYHQIPGPRLLGDTPYLTGDKSWTILPTDKTVTPDGFDKLASSGHSQYLMNNSTSQYNLSRIIAGSTP